MRTLVIWAMSALLIAALVSCNGGESNARSAIQQAYQQGAADAIKEVQNRVRQSKQQLMRQIQPTLLTGAVIVLLLAFFGDIIAERLREKLVSELELTPERQRAIISGGYLLLSAAIAICSLIRSGAEWSLPVLLLLTGATGVFFIGYLPLLFKPAEREARRLALAKIKLLLFAACVILAIHELLADDGWLRLQI